MLPQSIEAPGRRRDPWRQPPRISRSPCANCCSLGGLPWWPRSARRTSSAGAPRSSTADRAAFLRGGRPGRRDWRARRAGIVLSCASASAKVCSASLSRHCSGDAGRRSSPGAACSDGWRCLCRDTPPSGWRWRSATSTSASGTRESAPDRLVEFGKLLLQPEPGQSRRARHVDLAIEVKHPRPVARCVCCRSTLARSFWCRRSCSAVGGSECDAPRAAGRRCSGGTPGIECLALRLFALKYGSEADLGIVECYRIQRDAFEDVVRACVRPRAGSLTIDPGSPAIPVTAE